MIPLAEPNLSGNEGRYLQECIETRFVSSAGPFVTRFEMLVAAAVDAPKVVATSSGTTGLHVALAAAGVGRDDLVILPSYTFIASANAISHCGAMPWLFDIDPDTWNLDSALLQRELASKTECRDGVVIHKASGRRVAAVMPVYAFGLPADMDAITAICAAYDLPVVADAAAAIGATYRGRALGRIGARLSVLSFNGNKTITAGGGGAVFGDDEALLGLVHRLTTTARQGPGYDHDRVGFNYRMTNLEAAVGCAQMERWHDLVAAKRRIRAAYDRAFAETPGVAAFPGGSGIDSACWLSGIVTQSSDAADTVRNKLAAAGIEAKPFWKPMHLQAPYRQAPTTDQPVSGGLWHRVVTLPSSTGLAETDQARAIAVVCEALA